MKIAGLANQFHDSPWWARWGLGAVLGSPLVVSIAVRDELSMLLAPLLGAILSIAGLFVFLGTRRDRRRLGWLWLLLVPLLAPALVGILAGTWTLARRLLANEVGWIVFGIVDVVLVAGLAAEFWHHVASRERALILLVFGVPLMCTALVLWLPFIVFGGL